MLCIIAKICSVASLGGSTPFHVLRTTISLLGQQPVALISSEINPRASSIRSDGIIGSWAELQGHHMRLSASLTGGIGSFMDRLKGFSCSEQIFTRVPRSMSKRVYSSVFPQKTMLQMTNSRFDTLSS